MAAMFFNKKLFFPDWSSDYNKAIKIYEKKNSISFLSMEEHKDGKITAKRDWESFFIVMCGFNGIIFDFATGPTSSDSTAGLVNEEYIRLNIMSTMVAICILYMYNIFSLINFHRSRISIRNFLFERKHLRELNIVDCEEFSSNSPNMHSKILLNAFIHQRIMAEK